MSWCNFFDIFLKFDKTLGSRHFVRFKTNNKISININIVTIYVYWTKRVTKWYRNWKLKHTYKPSYYIRDFHLKHIITYTIKATKRLTRWKLPNSEADTGFPILLIPQCSSSNIICNSSEWRFYMLHSWNYTNTIKQNNPQFPMNSLGCFCPWGIRKIVISTPAKP